MHSLVASNRYPSRNWAGTCRNFPEPSAISARSTISTLMKQKMIHFEYESSEYVSSSELTDKIYGFLAKMGNSNEDLCTTATNRLSYLQLWFVDSLCKNELNRVKCAKVSSVKNYRYIATASNTFKVSGCNSWAQLFSWTRIQIV